MVSWIVFGVSIVDSGAPEDLIEGSTMSEIRVAQTEDKEAIQRIYRAVVGTYADQDKALWIGSSN